MIHKEAGATSTYNQDPLDIRYKSEQLVCMKTNILVALITVIVGILITINIQAF